MRKLFSFLAAVLVAVAANAAVINITSETPDALRLALNSAADGDEIVMAAGTYVESNGNYIAFDGKNVTVKAAEGANVIIQPQVPITVSNSGHAIFENVKIDASRLTELADWYEHLLYVTDGNPNGFTFKGCELYGFNINKSMFYCNSTNKLAMAKFENCYFHDIMKSIIFVENTAGEPMVSVKNCTFANISTNAESYYAGVIDVRAAEATLQVDQCTFYNVIPMNTDYSCVSKITLAKGTVTNCIFMLPTAQDGIRAMRGVAATNCITFNYLKDSGTGIHSSVTQTNCVQVDPKFVDAANGNYTLGEGSPALTMNDGQPIGDPRWWPAAAPALEPATYYGAEGFLTEGAVIAPAQWTACEYNITRNADKTLTFVAEFTNDVTGLVGQINLGDGFKDMAKDGLKFTYSTTATYEDGAALEGAFFYFPYAGAAKRIDITYTVGAANEKPATPVDARMKGTYNIGGENADYATLSAAATDLRAKGLKGDVTLLICADIAEVANVGLVNETDYTITIAPNAAAKRTISFGDVADNVGPSGHIMIGYDMAAWASTDTKNVVIDGSFEGEGQYLEFQAGTVGGVVVVFYGKASNSVVKNCRLINPRTTKTNYVAQFRTEQGAGSSKTNFGPSNVGFENCYMEVNKTTNTQAIYYNGSTAATDAGLPKDCYVRGCEIVSNLRGIFFNGAMNAVIEGNTFRLAKASAGFLAHGIMGNVQKGTIIVRGNKFLELGTMNASAGEYGICGITASGNADVWVIENNVFAGLDAKADVAGKIVTHRYVRCGDSCVVRNNTFYLPVQTYKPATELVAAQAVTCLWLAGTKQYVAENNLFVSEETEVNNSLIRGALNENVKNNVFFHKGGNAAVLAGAVVAKTWEEFAALEGTAGSKWTEPKFVDAANGDFAIAEYNEGLLIPRLESVLTDIDGKDRAEQTCAGAFEFVDEPVVDDTYFEYTVTETIAKNTETEATGGTIIFGADKFETMNGTDLFGYKLDGDPSETNTKYVLCKLNRPLAENDVISITGFASSNPKDGQAFQVSLDRAGAQVVGTAATTVSKAMETLDIPVKADAAGATEFYITRVSVSVYFTAVKVHADDGTAIGISSIDAADAARKVMIDGQLFIIKGDAMYTITGARVK